MGRNENGKHNCCNKQKYLDGNSTSPQQQRALYCQQCIWDLTGGIDPCQQCAKGLSFSNSINSLLTHFLAFWLSTFCLWKAVYSFQTREYFIGIIVIVRYTFSNCPLGKTEKSPMENKRGFFPPNCFPPPLFSGPSHLYGRLSFRNTNRVFQE